MKHLIKLFDNKNLVVTLIIIILGIFLFRDLMLRENIYFIEDTSHYFYPAAGFNLSAIKSGEIPLWIPYRYGGHPWLADIQTSFFYFIDYFIINYFGLYYPNVIVMLHYLLMCIFMYFLGRTIKLDKFSSLIITIIFCVSGFIGETLKVGNLGIIKTVTYMPLVFLLLTKMVETPKIKYVILLTLTGALQFFAGHFQFFFYSSFLAFCYYIFLSIYYSIEKRNKKYIIKLLTYSILTVIITLLLVSIQLLPTYEFSNLSTRSGGVSLRFAAANSISPDKLLEFVFQNIYGSSEKDYIGLSVPNHLGYIGFFPLTIILAFFLFTKKRDKFQFYLSLFLLFMSVLAVLLSMGNHFPLFRFFFRYVFGFNFFRSVNRLLIIYTFCMSILAGISFRNIYYMEINPKIKYYIFVLFILALCFFGISSLIIYMPEKSLETLKRFYQYLWDNGMRGGGWHSATILYAETDRIYLLAFRILKYSLFFVASSAILYLIYIFKNRLKNIIFFSILVFLVLDLSYTYINLIQKTLRDPDVVSGFHKNIVDYLNEQDGIFRISSVAVIPYDISILQEFFEVSGYGSLNLLRYNQFISMVWGLNYRNISPQGGVRLFIYDSHLIDLLNIRYIVPYLNQMPKDQINTRYKLVYKDKESGQRIYENKSYQPRAWLVNNYEILKESRQRERQLTNGNFNFRQTVILEEAPSLKITNEQELVSSVKITDYKLNEIHLKVESNQNAILFLSENHYPGWFAYINGERKEMKIANHTFRAVSVPEGKNNIIVKFEPNSFKTGLRLSLSGFLILIVLFIAKFIIIIKPLKNKDNFLNETFDKTF